MLKLQNKIPSALTIGGKIVERIKMRNEVVWGRVQTPLYIQNTYNGSNTVTIQQTLLGSPDSSTYAKHLQFSKNGLNWTTITLSSTAYTITLNKGEKVYFRGNEGVFNYWYSGGAKKAITTISANQTHTVGGNINTLLDYQDPYSLTLPQGAFNSIFENNTKLTSASDITLPPSVDGSLSSYCYLYLFKNCTNLTTVPKSIPAKKQGQDACNGMFAYTAITTAPTLTATTLSNGCYYSLFEGCSKLVNAPQLPATEMKPNCYRSLFYGCTSLVNPPKLPATTMATGCYQQLFRNCSKLVNAPALPAKVLVEGCYRSTFQGCSKLNNITVYADDISATNCTFRWLYNVASEGIFNNYGSATYEKDSPSGIPTGWTQNRDKTNYFYIENVDETDGQITFTTIASKTLPSSNLYSNKVEYSSDKKNWNTINFDTTTPQVIPINIGEKLYFRNNSGSFNCYDNGYYITTITTNKKSNVGGNLNTLLKYNEEILDISDKPSCFRQLFKDSQIVDASNLIMPATTLSRYCYAEFFSGNNKLIAAPELPAVNLAENCYYRFFYECISLTVSPSLPATTLADGCYLNMYERCYNLTTAPVLVATTLVPNCYKWMFSSCYKLSSVTIYAKTIADNALEYWLNNVASSGTIYNHGLLYMPERTPSGVPSGWKEEFPPMESVTANPDTFTIKSFETRVECASTLTITTTTGITTTTVNNKTTVIVGENTGDTTRTIPETLHYRGIPYEVTIIQTANDPIQ